MKRILLAIAHFGSSNREHFLSCMREYNSFKNYNIDVHAYLTEEIDFSEFDNLPVTQHIHDKSVGHFLTHQHKQLFLEKQNEYDYFMYCEDDVMVKNANMDAYMEVQSVLPEPFVCGFMRYELKANNPYRFLLDNHPCHSCHRGGNTVIKSNYVINGEQYFEVYNVHQASYILPQNLMKRVLDSGQYMEHYGLYAGVLEDAASNVFVRCGLIKVIPRKRVSELVVHHMANKYMAMHPTIYIEETTPDDKKMETMQLDLPPIYV